MLILKRIQYFNEFIKCHVSGKVMMYGDFYYEDTNDGSIVDAVLYHKLKKTQETEVFDNSILNNATSEKEYTDRLKQVEQAYLQKTILYREILGET